MLTLYRDIFNASKIELSSLSRYRVNLMGMATLMIIVCHASASDVMMPNWLAKVFDLGNYGVDIFLFLSGLGGYYSLDRLYSSPQGGGMVTYYKRRCSRILIPYLLVFIPYCIILFFSNRYTVGDCLLSVTALEFWIYHRGAWFVSLIIVLYFFSPFLFKGFRGKYGCLIAVFLLVILTLINGFHISQERTNLFYNIQFAFGRAPNYILGMAIGPACKEGKELSIWWVLIMAIFGFAIIKYGHFGSSILWMTTPLVLLIVLLFVKFIELSQRLIILFKWLGSISLESYLVNITLNTVLNLFFAISCVSALNRGKYLQYSIVVFGGLALATVINMLSKWFLKHFNLCNGEYFINQNNR